VAPAAPLPSFIGRGRRFFNILCKSALRLIMHLVRHSPT
jgi:hypothetical protein